MKQSTSDRFWAKVEITGFCWNWTAGKNRSGYGKFGCWADGVKKTWSSHRFAYTELVGEIPEGLVIDHLCRNRACVNPDHFDVVPPGVNTSRNEMSRRSHCPQGHRYDADNTRFPPSGGRMCKQCGYEQLKKLKQEIKAAKVAARQVIGNAAYTRQSKGTKVHSLGTDGRPLCGAPLDVSKLVPTEAEADCFQCRFNSGLPAKTRRIYSRGESSAAA